MTTVEVKSQVLEWAIGRSGRSPEELEQGLQHLRAWRSGEKRPTLKQLEKLAAATRTPIGFFFLSAPPTETIPIPDLRTVADRGVSQPSADLLETIHQCQQRQTWYEEYARAHGHQPLDFVGSVTLEDSPLLVAGRMRQQLDFDLEARAQLRTWEDSLRHLVAKMENAGIMVMVSGIVGCNTSRKLNLSEFRGFALAHPLAPLIFVNGSDSKSAQMFTLAHELAHLWLGQSGLSNAATSPPQGQALEQWCNQVAAELLMPIAVTPTRVEWARLGETLRELAKNFKVSNLVVLRRLHDSGALTQEQFWSAFHSERERLTQLAEEKEPGGQFYPTHANRIGRVLGKALASDTLEGRTSFTQAFQLMAIKKLAAFEELARRFGVES